MSQPRIDAAKPPQGPARSRARRWAPLLALVAVSAAAIYFFGGFLSFEALKENREALLAWRAAHGALAALIFFLGYALVVALSIPGALWMTLLGGFLFGVELGAPLIVAAATLGATGVFLIARSSLGAGLRGVAGPWLARLEAGFRADAWSYLLILRLIPVAPFCVVNLASAFLGARLWSFVWTTAVGVAPATVVYASVGAGLGEVIDEGGEPNLGMLLEPQVLGPLVGLALLAALPVLVKRLRAARGLPEPVGEGAAR